MEPYRPPHRRARSRGSSCAGRPGSVRPRWLLQRHLAAQRHLDGHRASTAPAHPIRVVCVADTHNTRPELPPGDVLVHAGDLTDHGSFAEVQAGLAWLAAQPHRHKLLGRRQPRRAAGRGLFGRAPGAAVRPGGRGDARRSWTRGDVTYVEDRLVRLVRLAVGAGGDDDDGPDIPVTHGPPKLHRDQRDWYRAGCAHLAAQVALLRPRLCVFGHIHAGYGREDGVVVDAARGRHDAAVFGWAGGWAGVAWLAVLVAAAAVRAAAARGLQAVVGGRWRPGPARATTFVNAAVVGGPGNELRNAPIVVEI